MHSFGVNPQIRDCEIWHRDKETSFYVRCIAHFITLNHSGVTHRRIRGTDILAANATRNYTALNIQKLKMGISGNGNGNGNDYKSADEWISTYPPCLSFVGTTPCT